MKKEMLYSFHIPRWEELPDFDLYMDQVVKLLDTYLAPLKAEDEKAITSTMVNNYVKQKLVKPSVKKKYTRLHLAYLIVVFILKKVYSIQEIVELISLQIHTFPVESSYNVFCDVFEKTLIQVFSQQKTDVDYGNADSELAYMLQNVVTSIACKIYAAAYIEEQKINPSNNGKKT